MTREALIVIPTYLRDGRELEIVRQLLESLRATEPDAPVVLIDDASPAELELQALDELSSRFDAGLIRKDSNDGFSATVNIGLQMALDGGLDAVLCNADIQFRSEGWLDIMQRQPKLDGDGLAEMVGALLSYPSGLIQHGGIFFSFITRAFDHVNRYAPENMPEAQVPRVLPCTGALQFIRWECLREHGLYDEDFRMGYEDVDYCIRVLRAGGECVYQPLIWAYHYESLFRGQKSPKIEEWEIGSWITFRQKWAGENFARYCPSIFQ